MTQPGKILIVDDEAKNIKLLPALLTPRGYEVIAASNGDEALQQVEQVQPDLILLDVMMPGMDGFTLCKRLQDNAETLLIPVIMLTALDQVKDRIKGIEAGADGFLTKPVHRDELLAQISILLQKTQAIERHVRPRRPNPSHSDIAHSPLFEGLSQTSLDEIVKHMRKRYFATNTFLFHQGDSGESLFVIRQGCVEVLRLQPEGMQTVDRLHQGDVVGEMALVTGTPRMASAVAIEPTEVLEFIQEASAMLMSRYPAILHNISRLSMYRQKCLLERDAIRKRPSLAELVFISHASADKETADTVCQLLEVQGRRCWIAPRDVPPGARFGKAIVEAIERSVAVVLIFSDHANTSEHVMSEVERTVSHHKDIFPLRIAHAMPSSELAYFISCYHWLDASTVPLKAVVEQVATMLRSSVFSSTSAPTRTLAALEEAEALFAP
jgi:DNA-binding response OmpR family regulator